jgi:hypothetical protein
MSSTEEPSRTVVRRAVGELDRGGCDPKLDDVLRRVDDDALGLRAPRKVVLDL